MYMDGFQNNAKIKEWILSRIGNFNCNSKIWDNIPRMSSNMTMRQEMKKKF